MSTHLTVFLLLTLLIGCRTASEKDISSLETPRRAMEQKPVLKREFIALDTYTLSLGPKQLTCFDDNASGLSYNSTAKSLYVVENSDSIIAEIDLRGETHRIFETWGLRDVEAICHTGTRLIIAEEEGGISHLTVKGDAAVADSFAPPSLPDAELGNSGLEGLCYDATEMRIFCAKEKHPPTVYEVRGHVWKPLPINLPSLMDISGLHYDPQSGHLLLLSDESQCIVEVKLDGAEVSRISLQAGSSGLEQGIPQAEGIAMDEERNIYVCSEPNLFYVFSKARPSQEIVSAE